MRIGILGGTFDPIHFGHLLLAQEALEKLHLGKVIFVPCYLPPHKYRRDITKAKMRFKMVTLAIKSNSKFSASTLEIDRKGKSYSVETLRQLTNICGKNSKLFFITGSDSLEELVRWKDISEIMTLAKFVIAQRPRYPLPPKIKESLLFKEILKSIQFITVTSLDISSSQIRRNIKKKKSIRYLLPEEVRKFIVRNKLYQ